MALSRRAVVSEVPAGRLKSLSLKFFASLIGNLNPASASELSGPLAAIVSRLAGLDRLQLFPDWSPPREPELADVTCTNATATSLESSSAPAAAALTPGNTSNWVSSQASGFGSVASAVNAWSCDVPASTPLYEVLIHWDTSSGKRLLPASVALETRTDEKSAWVTAVTVDGDGITDVQRIRLPAPVSCGGIRVTMTGFHAANKQNRHGISHFRAFSKGGDGSHVSAKAGLSALQAWMTAMIQSSDDAVTSAVKDTALAGLAALSASSGSLLTLLRLYDLLLSREGVIEAGSQLSQCALELQQAIRDAAWTQKQVQSTFELNYSGAAAGGGPGWGEIKAGA